MDLFNILLLALAGAAAVFLLAPKAAAPVAVQPAAPAKKKGKKKKNKPKAPSSPASAPEPEPEPEPEEAKDEAASPSKNALRKARRKARKRTERLEREAAAKKEAAIAKKAARKAKKAARKQAAEAEPTSAAELEAAYAEEAEAEAALEEEWEDVAAIKARKKQPKKESTVRRGPQIKKTIDVGSSIPALMGKGGSGVKSIRQEANVDIRVPRREDKSTVVTVTGSADGVAKALELIRARIAGGRPVDDRECRTITIDQKSVPLVIGRNGATIRLIETESNASVRVSKEGTPTVEIRGDPEQIDAAEALIEKVIAGRGLLNGTSETIALAEGQDRVVIGPKGATVNRIKDLSDAQINIKPTHVDVFGTPEQVAIAIREINAILADYEVVEMQLEDKQPGVVIGRSGATVIKLQRETGANIDVNRQTSVATVSGSKASVKKALSAIQAVLSAPRTFNPLPDGVESEIIDLGGLVSRVIGRKGATMKKIQTDTGAKLDFLDQTVRISGSADEIAAAHKAVDDIVEAEAKREADRLRNLEELLQQQAAAAAADDGEQLGDDDLADAAAW